MAKEAALGVREDGMTLAEVAAEVGRKVQRYDAFMDSFDVTVRATLLAAAPGDLVAYKQLAGSDTPVPFRPLCRYPTYPRYLGSGDPDSASSFTCANSENSPQRTQRLAD